MKRKKEIIIIICILIAVIVLILIPIITENNKHNNVNTKEEVIETESNEITLTIEGEINYRKNNSISDDDIVNTFEIKTFKGITYGELLKIINQYRTEYTVFEEDYLKSYDKSQKIIIESSYIYPEEYIEPVIINEDLININEASLLELKSLYGIGEKRAEMIYEYIKEGNRFNSFQELKSFLGVSDEVITRIEEKAFL